MRSSVLDDIPKSRLWRNPICPTGSRFSTSCWPQGANQWSAFADESMPVTWADGHERACRTKDVRVSLMTPGINVRSAHVDRQDGFHGLSRPVSAVFGEFGRNRIEPKIRIKLRYFYLVNDKNERMHGSESEAGNASPADLSRPGAVAIAVLGRSKSPCVPRACRKFRHAFFICFSPDAIDRLSLVKRKHR
jgi:hypothetical protein